MSIDKLITELLAGFSALTAVTEKNNALLERVVAGQEAAIAKLDAGQGSPTTRTRRSGKTETPAAETPAAETASTPAAQPDPVHPLLVAPNADTKKNDKGEDEPSAAYRANDFSRQEVKNEFIGWLGETTDPAERKPRADFVGAIGQHFGVKQPFHPETGLKDDETRKQALFYLRRKRAGLSVNFGQDYDFDADPLADNTAEAADDFDALG